MATRRSRAGRPLPGRILAGENEPIFDALPEGVMANLRRAGSENVLVWNLIYPHSAAGLPLQGLLALPRLWGSAVPREEDRLVPYFWGFSVAGERCPMLDDALMDVDGPGPQTEIDLILLGARTLVVVEAKRSVGPGRCGRYLQGRCPEIHLRMAAEQSCRYWEDPTARFNAELSFGDRPTTGDPSPPCNRHYQLARTLLVGRALEKKLAREFHLWLFVGRRQWRSIERDWVDFTDRLRNDDLWRRSRVIAWEDIRSLHAT